MIFASRLTFAPMMTVMLSELTPVRLLRRERKQILKTSGYVRKRIGRNDDDSQRLCEMSVCSGVFCENCLQNCFYTEIIQGV